MLPAYVTQVFIVEFAAERKISVDERGPNYVLVIRGQDGSEDFFSPPDVVYEDFSELGRPDCPGSETTLSFMNQKITGQKM